MSIHTMREPKPTETDDSRSVKELAHSILRSNFPEGSDPAVDLLLQGIDERIERGNAEYGQDLMTHDGRNNKVDLWQETVDMVNYTIKEMAENADEDGVLPEDVSLLSETLINAALQVAEYLKRKNVV